MRPGAHPDRFNHLSDKLLDRHVAKAKQSLGVAKIGLEGDGLIKSKQAADILDKHLDLDDASQKVVDESKDNIIGSTLKDSKIAAKSLKNTIDGDEEGADKELNEGLITADKIKDKLKEAAGKHKTSEELNTEVTDSLASNIAAQKTEVAAKEAKKKKE